MRVLNGLAGRPAILILVLAAVSTPVLAQTVGGPAVAVQLDSLFLYRGTMEPSGQLSSSTFSPFVGLEIRLVRPVSLRVGVSPPTGQQPGTQAFATYLALQAWLGRGPHFLELGIGSYYQNTWCNGVPDYRAYTASLGWRFVADRMVFRFGGVLGISSGGKLASGLALGLGRSI